MAANVPIMPGYFNYSLVSLINKFHTAVGTAAPCNLPRIMWKVGLECWKNELHLLDHTDI